MPALAPAEVGAGAGAGGVTGVTVIVSGGCIWVGVCLVSAREAAGEREGSSEAEASEEFDAFSLAKKSAPLCSAHKAREEKRMR